MEKLNKLLEDSNKEYKKITDAASALLRGEISGEEFNRVSTEMLGKVDLLLLEYNAKN